MNRGIGVSKGYGVGRIVVINNDMPSYEAVRVTDTDKEKERFKKALELFTEKTTAMAEKMRNSVGEHNAAILEGHITMISDPFMQETILDRINDGECAEKALDDVCTMFIDMFSQTGDELTVQRAADIADIRVRILKILTDTPDISISDVPKGTVIVAKDLTPSMTAGIVKENVEGILTETGGKTSHSAILARALEIPCVLSIENITGLVQNGMEAVVDGSAGIAILEPDEDTVREYKEKKEKYIAEKEALKVYKGKETLTKDNQKVLLYCNIGKPDDVKNVLEYDGEGIGLFRTEFLFMESDSLPDEEAQFEAYKSVAKAMNGKDVIIRTLDVGGDKEIAYLGMEKEENPFLGFRAVRFCLQREDVYRPQLRALLRASAFGNIKIMVPLVTCVDEIRAVKALVQDIKKELDEKNIAYDKDIQIGAMIETAAASEIADLLAKEADFFSIGTNDLTQYTMSVDRGNSKVAYLYSVYNPAVLRSLKRIIGEANKAGITVGMCGEAAADPLLTPLLISFGLHEYSVSANMVLATRASVAKWSRAEADKAAEEVMKLATEKEVKQYLESIAG